MFESSSDFLLPSTFFFPSINSGNLSLVYFSSVICFYFPCIHFCLLAVVSSLRVKSGRLRAAWRLVNFCYESTRMLSKHRHAGELIILPLQTLDPTGPGQLWTVEGVGEEAAGAAGDSGDIAAIWGQSPQKTFAKYDQTFVHSYLFQKGVSQKKKTQFFNFTVFSKQRLLNAQTVWPQCKRHQPQLFQPSFFLKEQR